MWSYVSTCLTPERDERAYQATHPKHPRPRDPQRVTRLGQVVDGWREAWRP